MTNTHNKSLSSSAFDKLRPIWDEFVIHEIEVWKKFHEYWLQDICLLSNTEGNCVVKTKRAKTLVIRYEDLLLNENVRMTRSPSYHTWSIFDM